MTITTFEKAVKQYNDLMFDICREYNTIGTSYTEGNERQHWTLRDLVSEVQYTLDIYLDEDCLYWREAHDPTQHSSKPWYKEWINITRRMRRFVARYKDEAMLTKCFSGHCSKYD